MIPSNGSEDRALGMPGFAGSQDVRPPTYTIPDRSRQAPSKTGHPGDKTGHDPRSGPSDTSLRNRRRRSLPTALYNSPLTATAAGDPRDNLISAFFSEKCPISHVGTFPHLGTLLFEH